MLSSKNYSSRGIQWCIYKNLKIKQSHTHTIMDKFNCIGWLAHVRVTVWLRDLRIFLDAPLNRVDNSTHQKSCLYKFDFNPFRSTWNRFLWLCDCVISGFYSCTNVFSSRGTRYHVITWYKILISLNHTIVTQTILT